MRRESPPAPGPWRHVPASSRGTGAATHRTGHTRGSVRAGVCVSRDSGRAGILTADERRRQVLIGDEVELGREHRRSENREQGEQGNQKVPQDDW